MGAVWELLSSTANPAQFEWKWAGLAVLVTPKWLPQFLSYIQHIFLLLFKKEPTNQKYPHIFDI